VIEEVDASLQAGRTACDGHALEAAQAGIRRRRSGQIEIDVVGDEQVEPPIPVVVDEGTPGVPAQARLREASGLCDIVESSAAGVVEQPVLAVVGDEQILVAVVVVIA
jgi:hypothetical protein